MCLYNIFNLILSFTFKVQETNTFTIEQGHL